jgi:hypothetical protein
MTEEPSAAPIAETGVRGGTLASVNAWTSETACALQAALRMSNEAFAAHLGVAPRTVGGWHEKPTVRPQSAVQQSLDNALERASPAAKERFAEMSVGTDHTVKQQGHPERLNRNRHRGIIHDLSSEDLIVQQDALDELEEMLDNSAIEPKRVLEVVARFVQKNSPDRAVTLRLGGTPNTGCLRPYRRRWLFSVGHTSVK